jgi:branched-chain amino acid transport system substrate-binding protein
VTTRPRIRKTLALAVLPALAVAACSSAGASNSGRKTAGSGDTIVVGATLSLTGSLSALAPPLEAGYQQEIANVNAGGGIAIGGAKKKLQLVVMNNASNPATASNQASELVRKDHAVALLGFATPQIVTTTALVAEQLRVPFLTSQMPVEAFASGDKSGWRYSWDLFYDERQQAAAAARALASVPVDKKVKRVALFTDNEPDSEVERPLYQAAFKADGLDLVGDYTFPLGTTNFSSFIAAAKARGAELVAGQLAPADGVTLWKQLKSLALRPKAAFLIDASDGDSVWSSLGGLAQDTLSEGYWSPSQASPGQLAAITPTLGKKYAGTPNYATAAVAYAVAEVLTDAIARAGSASPGQINTAISHADAPTIAGPIKFRLTTHTAITPCYINQWQNGKLLQVQPLAHGVTLAVPTAGLG